MACFASRSARSLRSYNFIPRTVSRWSFEVDYTEIGFIVRVIIFNVDHHNVMTIS